MVCVLPSVPISSHMIGRTLWSALFNIRRYRHLMIFPSCYISDMWNLLKCLRSPCQLLKSPWDRAEHSHSWSEPNVKMKQLRTIYLIGTAWFLKNWAVAQLSTAIGKALTRRGQRQLIYCKICPLPLMWMLNCTTQNLFLFLSIKTPFYILPPSFID